MMSAPTNHEKSRQRRLEHAVLITLIMAISLITASCGGGLAQKSVGGQSLALLGSLPAGAIYQSYNATLTVTGGASPYQFSIASGSLPPGVTLNPATGSFTGQLTTSGTYSFQVAVTDLPHADSGAQSYSVQIGPSQVNVNVTPTPVTLSSGGTQQFASTVSGTGTTSVTWAASAGSVDSTGLYTAPSAQSTTQVTVTATSQIDPTKSASASVTVNPSEQVLQIATSGLPQAQQGVPYAADFTATGGTQPYSWSVTVGSLPSGVTLNSNGALTGMPGAAGTFNFSVMVTDAASETSTGAFSLAVTSESGFDGPAQLPQVTIASAMADSPAPGAVITVQTADDLKTALNNAQCGETIELQTGAPFAGPFTLLPKSCNDQNWIIIRTSSPDTALPPEGQRVTPCYAGVSSLQGRPAYSCQTPTNVLATVQMASPGNGPFVIADGANFYRFVGLEITRQNGIKGGAALISLAGTADHIIVDRSWLHGNPQDETSNGFGASGGTYIAVVDSYFTDFHCIAKTGTCTEAHAISGGVGSTQDGPYKIQNNFLEASTQAVLFGGGAATLTPTDITIAGNHFFKPWQWMTGNTPFVGGPDGNPFIVKNHLELKNAIRLLAENNLMENVWGGFTQTGHAILLTPKSQHSKKKDTNNCPLCQVTDVTLRYTQISHEGGGIVVATANSGDGGDGGPALAGTRFSIHDVVIDDLNQTYGGGSGFEIVNGWAQNPVNTITINHVTVFPDPGSHIMTIGNQLENPSMYGFVFTNNLVLTGRYPVWNALGGNDSCALGDVPVTTITTCFTTNTFEANGLIASPDQYPPSTWPTGNYFPATPADVQFVNYNNGNGGNYQLLSSSPYKNAGIDGKDLGADIIGLNQVLAGVP